MTKFFNTTIGRLRLVAFLEGLSLLILVFIAMPMKYIWGDPAMVKLVGAIHGGLFLLFIFIALQVSIEHKWKFSEITWKVLLASMIPFGTFYIDSRILRKMQVAGN